MRGFVANTDYDWYEFLRQRRDLDEVNFWRPSGKLNRFEPGTPFFFKLKAPHNAICGFGYFARASSLPCWLAWEAFGEKNGAATLDQMRTRVEKYREAGMVNGDYEVGCLMITQPTFFAPGQWVSQPSNWKKNIVAGAGYDLAEGEGLRMLEECRERAVAAQLPLIAADSIEQPRFGEPMLVRPRLGQGTFRIAVTDAYERACAITTEHSLPVLEAAHIRPYASEGSHEVRNGLLLRSDIHRLFDRGYVTVTPELKFEVSRRLRADFGNGRAYEHLHGQLIHVPKNPSERPDPVALAWHNEKCFKAA